MPAFIPVIHLDTLELAGSLRTRWGQFKLVDESGLPLGYRILPLRGHARDTSEDDDRFANYAPTKGWPEYGNLRSEIARHAAAIMPPGIEYGRAFFEWVDPGATLDWTVEDAPYFERWQRAKVAIRTNPAVIWIAGTEVIVPAPGMLNLVNVRVPCAAANFGAHPFVALVLDFRLKSAVE